MKAAALMEYKKCKRTYKNGIMEAKRSAWRSLLKDLDRDQWGRGYKIVVKRTNLKRRNKLTDAQQMVEARKLFPDVEDRVRRKVVTTDEEVRPFTVEELSEATDRIKQKKAPGPDGILPEIAKVAVYCQKEIFLNMVNKALSDGEFPAQMKVAKLVLIPKSIKSHEETTAYRPISLLNVFGKIFEAILERRLRQEIDNKGRLHDKQHGFRRGHSTLNAMEEVIKIAKEATNKAAQNKSFCALVTLDVRNAFNEARWTGIISELERRNITRHIIELVKNYLSERVLLVGEEGEMRMSCGVPQGSILEPLLWNIYYDEVLDTEMPVGVTLIGYADDLAMVAVAKTGSELENKINTAVVEVTEWLHSRNLCVA